MSFERLIIQNIERDKLKESLEVEEVAECPVDMTEVLDLLCTLSTMSSKGYNAQPERTTQKQAYRKVESRLIEIGAGVKKERKKSSKDMPGEFEDISDVGKVK